MVTVLQGTIHTLPQPDLDISKVVGELSANPPLAAGGEALGAGPPGADPVGNLASRPDGRCAER